METWFQPDTFANLARAIGDWFAATVLTIDSAAQIASIFAAFATAKLAANWLIKACSDLKSDIEWYGRASRYIERLYMPFIGLLALTAFLFVYRSFGLPDLFLRLSVNLLMAWLVIRTAANLIRHQSLAHLVSAMAWSVAALNIVGWLDPAIAFLKSVTFDFGAFHLSVYSLMVGVLSIVFMVWMATLVSSVVEGRISKSASLTPSAKVLFSKILKITLIALALVIGLASTGVDLTAFAVFSGAVGVGIGFGLQKVISNLISGVILLLDRSIKPGDVIEVGQTYGWINSLAARYTSVITRDGQEHLIPNEDMITRPVVNWTYTSSKVRQKLPVNVSYKSDIKRAMALTMEAARETKRVIGDPTPNCLITGFGDNGVDLELRMWIQDPQNGVANVKSDVYLKIWDKFHEHGIEFPYPQRDIHFVDGTLKVEKGE